MKRLFDVCISGVLLLLLLPVFALTALLVAIRLGSPVLFVQARPGYRGNLFNMYKFRTMQDRVGADGQVLPDAERLTRFGAILRSTSLDELPELWNVFKGDMSLVGPRPLLAEYLPLYTREQARRHDVRPGMTGWAQVNGRNAISWDDKFRLDVWYVDHRTLWLDLKILLMTVRKVFLREGIQSEGHATVQKFTGSANGGAT